MIDKTQFKIKLFCLIIILITANKSIAQWEPDIRLTEDPAISTTSDNNARCVAIGGNIVHVVWTDNRNGNSEIYYKRSIDHGLTWGSDKRLTNNSSSSMLPSIYAEGPVVHVVWQDSRPGNYDIYYKRSSDGGISWDEDKQICEYPGNSRNPSILAFASQVHVVWRDDHDGNYEIYYKRSTDSGISWEPDKRLTNNSGDSYNPSISLSNNFVHVVWQDTRDGNYEIYHKRSTDRGETWGSDTRLTNNIALSYNPVVLASGPYLHVIWRDSRQGHYDIYHKRSSNDGISWESDVRLTQNFADSLVFCVASSGSALHLVWEDNRDGNYEIYYKRSTDRGTTWQADERLTFSPGFSFYAFVAASGAAVHVVWYDNRDGNEEIYYKRNPTANPVLINTGTQIPEKFSLSQNYPNPFNPNTIINYSITKNQHTLLKVYDVTGNEVSVLVNERQNAGSYSVEFDGSNLASGIYFYEIISGDFTEVLKMMLVR